MDDDDYKSYKQNQSTCIPEASQKDLDANSVFSSFKPLFCVCFSDNWSSFLKKQLNVYMFLTF